MPDFTPSSRDPGGFWTDPDSGEVFGAPPASARGSYSLELLALDGLDGSGTGRVAGSFGSGHQGDGGGDPAPPPLVLHRWDVVIGRQMALEQGYRYGHLRR